MGWLIQLAITVGDAMVLLLMALRLIPGKERAGASSADEDDTVVAV